MYCIGFLLNTEITFCVYTFIFIKCSFSIYSGTRQEYLHLPFESVRECSVYLNSMTSS